MPGPPAAKQLDIAMGIDTHIVLIRSPASPIPTPIPHPHVGILFDPLDLVPMVGTAVKVNGMPRVVPGTAGMAMPPHIPMGACSPSPPATSRRCSWAA